MTERKQRGGPGRGQGRKPIKDGHETVTVSLRMTEAQRDKLTLLGGAERVRQRIAKTNGQTESLTIEALSMGVENVVEAVCKLVNAAAEHCAKEANAGKLWSTK